VLERGCGGQLVVTAGAVVRHGSLPLGGRHLGQILSVVGGTGILAPPERVPVVHRLHAGVGGRLRGRRAAGAFEAAAGRCRRDTGGEDTRDGDGHTERGGEVG